ncbi:tetratricopeptide repeat protein [bacterium SCSIO 12643]|nr:tetratricopeptide repeat protein [bacterium SCSIO 12643]
MIRFIIFLLVLSPVYAVGSDEDAKRLDELEQLARTSYRTQIDSSIYYAREITTYDSNAYDTSYAFALNWLGICYMNKGLSDTANMWFEKAIDFARSRSIFDIVNKAYLNRSINYFGQGDYQKALDQSFNALESFHKTGDTIGEAHASYNIANAFNRLERYEEAKEYYHKAEKTYQNLNPKWSLANVYNALGTVHNFNEAYDSAIYYFNQSIDIKVAGGAEVYCASEYNNLASIYEIQGDVEKSKNYYIKSYQAAEYRGNYAVMGNSLHNLGLLYYNQKQNDSALFYMQKVVEILDVYDDEEEKMRMFLLYANIWSTVGQYDSAFYYLKTGSMLSDSIRGVEVQKEAVALHKKFQVAEKNEKLALQKVELLQQEKTQFYQYIAIASLLILVGFLLWTYIQKRKNDQLRLKASLNDERSRIAMDLHDHVGAELTVVTSNLDSRIYTSEYPVEKQNLEGVVAQVRKISEILRETVWSIRAESIMVKQLGERIRTFSERFSEESIKLEMHTNCSDRVLTPQIALTSYRVCQEAITNAFKYSKGTKISIKIELKSHQLIFSVEDDGIGFNVSESEERGFGLYNMQHRVEKTDGEFHLISEENKGTQIKWQFSV